MLKVTTRSPLIVSGVLNIKEDGFVSESTTLLLESTYLVVQSLDLGGIVAGQPEGALPGGGVVVVPSAVETAEFVGAGLVSGGGSDVALCVPFAASAMRSMLVLGVGLTTHWAAGACLARVSGVAPTPAVGATGDSRPDGGGFDEALDVIDNDASVREELGPGPRLGIPDVEEHGHACRVLGLGHHPDGRCELEVPLVWVVIHSAVDVFRGSGVARELVVARDPDNHQERLGLRDAHPDVIGQGLVARGKVPSNKINLIVGWDVVGGE